MKFRCERDTLADAIGSAGRAVSTRGGALPVLSGIEVTAREGTVELVGSDLELTVRLVVPADVDAQGTAVVPARLFGEIVRNLEAGPVNVAVVDDDAHIEAGRSAFSVRLLPAGDFPELAPVEGASATLDASALAEALRQVVPAASRDDARPILTGVLLAATRAGLRLVATDSYRLAVRDLAGVSMLPEGQQVLVGAKALAEVQRLLTGDEISVTLSERDVSFRVGPAEVSTRLIEGDFPNYEQLIPSGYPNRLTVGRDALDAAVKRVRLVSQGRDAAPVRVSMAPDRLELSAIAQEVGEAREVLEAKFEGTELTVAFNPEFLLDGIHAVGGDEVVLETIDPLKPATLRAVDDSDYLYLLMPVRIS